MRSINENWALELDYTYRSRIAKGERVYWRTGRTVWATVQESAGRSIDERLASFKQEAPPHRIDQVETREGGLVRYGYLVQEADDRRVTTSEGFPGIRFAWYALVLSDAGDVNLCIYFDVARDVVWAQGVVDSIRPVAVPARLLEQERLLRQLSREVGGAVVSEMVIGEGMPVGFIYRERPERAGDSGWRILSGREDDAYLKDPENLRWFCDLWNVLEMDPGVGPLLLSEFPCAFERDERTGRFRRIEIEEGKLRPAELPLR